MANTPCRPIRIDDELWNELLAAVQEDKLSVSEIARRALRAYLVERKTK
jgi:metal-responsive CopG/Arc/MetJ family transcriptional regulator